MHKLQNTGQRIRRKAIGERGRDLAIPSDPCSLGKRASISYIQPTRQGGSFQNLIVKFLGVLQYSANKVADTTRTVLIQE